MNALKWCVLIVAVMATAACTRSRTPSDFDLPLAVIPPARETQIAKQTFAIPPTSTPTVSPDRTATDSSENNTTSRREMLGGATLIVQFSDDASSFIGLLDTEATEIHTLDAIDPACVRRVHCDIELAPNRRLLAYYDSEGYLTLLNTQTMEAEQVAHGGTTGDRFVAWSPDSRHLAFVRDRDLYRLEVASRDEMLVAQHYTREYYPMFSDKSTIRELQIANPVWLREDTLLFNDFAPPQVLLGGAETRFQSTYYLQLGEADDVRIELFPAQILLSYAPSRTRIIVRATSESAASDQIIDYSASNEQFTRIGRISRGSKHAWFSNSLLMMQILNTGDDEKQYTELEIIGFDPERSEASQFEVPHPITGTVWSIDGRHVLFISNNVLYALDVLDGAYFPIIHFEQSYDVELIALLDSP